jgi:hypothetical protein
VLRHDALDAADVGLGAVELLGEVLQAHLEVDDSRLLLRHAIFPLAALATTGHEGVECLMCHKSSTLRRYGATLSSTSSSLNETPLPAAAPYKSTLPCRRATDGDDTLPPSSTFDGLLAALEKALTGPPPKLPVPTVAEAAVPPALTEPAVSMCASLAACELRCPGLGARLRGRRVTPEAGRCRGHGVRLGQPHGQLVVAPPFHVIEEAHEVVLHRGVQSLRYAGQLHAEVTHQSHDGRAADRIATSKPDGVSSSGGVGPGGGCDGFEHCALLLHVAQPNRGAGQGTAIRSSLDISASAPSLKTEPNRVA